MERWVGKVALVTGASSGIGAAVAKSLAFHGLTVVGCAPDEMAVEQMQLEAEKEGKGSKGSFHPVRCDLRKTAEIQEMFDTVKSKFGGVDVCINNAGVCHSTQILEGEHEKWRDMLEVNVMGSSMCTAAAIKSMRERETDGHVININSISGHRVSPSLGIGFYSMTKFALGALTESVRRELRDLKSNIRISQVSPGLVDTPIHNSYGREETLRVCTPLETSDIVGAVIYILSQPQRVQVHDILIRPTDQQS